jgi:hypothetical protein
MATWKDITPPPSPLPPKLPPPEPAEDDPTKPLLKRGEKHKEKFEDDIDRRKEARGYMVVLACNLLSCWALCRRGPLAAHESRDSPPKPSAAPTAAGTCGAA